MKNAPEIARVGSTNGSALAVHATVLISHCRATRSFWHRPSSIAAALWPDRQFRSNQGAARAAMGVITRLGGYKSNHGMWKISIPDLYWPNNQEKPRSP